MTEIIITEQLQAHLRDRTIVLTGGAQGIGAATVELLQKSGANVVFGDWAAEQGAKLEKHLNAARSRQDGYVHFLHLDVREHASQLALFDKALAAYGRVDVAISCAAVGEPGGWFEPDDLNLETVRKEPLPLKNTIDINLTSVVSFCRMALAFMKPSVRTSSEEPLPNAGASEFSKSIVLVSSIAGITEAPGLFAYSPAKHGVIGLMRALRKWAPVRYGVRTNAICPWATDTQIFAGAREKWIEQKLPLNTPENVARMIVQCAINRDMNGRSIFVSGGRGFDTEEGYDKTLPQWMGDDNARVWLKGQDVLGLGDDWT